jgi:hypothetical protein
LQLPLEIRGTAERRSAGKTSCRSTTFYPPSLHLFELAHEGQAPTHPDAIPVAARARKGWPETWQSGEERQGLRGKPLIASTLRGKSRAGPLFLSGNALDLA